MHTCVDESSFATKDIYINRYMYTFNHFKVSFNIQLFVAVLKHIYAHEHKMAPQ